MRDLPSARDEGEPLSAGVLFKIERIDGPKPFALSTVPRKWRGRSRAAGKVGIDLSYLIGSGHAERRRSRVWYARPGSTWGCAAVLGKKCGSPDASVGQLARGSDGQRPPSFSMAIAISGG